MGHYLKDSQFLALKFIDCLLGILFDMNVFMKKLLFYLMLCFFVFSFSHSDKDKQTSLIKQDPPNNEILWSKSRKLAWEDFQGKPDKNSKFGAGTSARIGFKYEVFDDYIIFNFPAYFTCSLSWSKFKNSPELLKHEQLHFDINELAARKIRQECNKHESKKLSESSDIIQKIYDRNHNYRDSIDNEYDSETEHGVNQSKQKEWELKIAKELAALDAYSLPQVKIKRVKEN